MILADDFGKDHDEKLLGRSSDLQDVVAPLLLHLTAESTNAPPTKQQ